MTGTITTDLALVNTTGGDTEVITNWTTTAAWSATPAVSNDVFLQGSNAINARASSATPGTIALYWDHLTTGTANLDLSAGAHVFAWIKCITLPSMENKVRGGIGVSISSTAGVVKVGTDPWSGITDSKQWFILGADSDPLSGWVCYVVDPTSTADYSTGTPLMSSVDRIGLRVGALQTVGGGAVKPNNIIWDAFRYGTGITVKDGTSGSPVAFEDLYSTDSTTANQWGIIGKNTGTYFLAGKINIGTAAQTAVTVLTDTNRVIVYRDQPVGAGFYEIVLAGAASFGTTLTLGSISGTLTSSGCTIKGTGLTTRRLIAPVIVSGGTGGTYVVGNILTVSGGTGTAATMKVISVTTGVITSLQMETPGIYSVPPTGTLTLTGGGGTGATCTATVAGGSIWTLSASAANQTINLYSCTLQQMKSAALTTTSTLDGCIISDSGEITVGGATIKNCLFQDLRTITPISATYQLRVTTTTPVLTNNRYVNCATALLWDRNADVSSKIDNSSFTSGGTGHGIEFGSNTPITLTFTNVTFTGYGGTPGSNGSASSGSTDAAVYNNSGKTITITISGGTTPAVRNGAGATTVIVTSVVTLKTTVLNALGSPIQNARVAIYKSSDNSELMNSLTDASGIATTTFSYISDTAIYIRARKTSTGITRYINNDSSGTIISTGFTSTITLVTDIIASP
jgi:hypothetical protein